MRKCAQHALHQNHQHAMTNRKTHVFQEVSLVAFLAAIAHALLTQGLGKIEDHAECLDIWHE